MKSYIFRTSSILAVLLLLVALGLTSSTAQQTGTRQQQPAQQEELRIPQLAVVQEMEAETLRIKVPRECERITPEVQMHDVADNFNPSGNPVTLNPALVSFLSGKPVKGYDNPSRDTVFADSFKLRSCRVCYATLEVRVRHQAGPWIANASNYSNDTLLAGTAPFATTLRYMGSVNIWSADLPNPKNVTLSTSSAGLSNLNNYVFNNTPAFLDVVAQDDTEFDYAKLSVWYY